MKNLLKIIILTIITSFIFSACGKQMSITKRKYNKGYYVSHSHKKPDVKPQPSNALAKAEKSESLPPVTVKPEAKTTAVNNEKEPTVTASVSKPAEVQNSQQQNSNNVMANTKLTKKFFKAKPLEKLLPSKAYLTELKKKMRRNSDDDDALSLLWIVIVILLILYLLGLIAGGWGLGWAIHILVIVAVVLLILWLLRIL